ncbi:MAG: hypothetical protein QM405_00560 [Euryarchaeota archaeon]|nr:hypothetical protein [Euryarchaeota archaeon]
MVLPAAHPGCPGHITDPPVPLVPMIPFFLGSWLLTVTLEAAVLGLALKSKPAWQVLFYSALVNSLTLPLAQYLYLHYLDNLVLMEAVVVLVEAPLIYLLLGVETRWALTLSVLANLVSALVGLLLLTHH